MLKKQISLLLSLLIIATAVGCSKKEENKSVAANQEQQVTDQNKTDEVKDKEQLEEGKEKSEKPQDSSQNPSKPTDKNQSNKKTETTTKPKNNGSTKSQSTNTTKPQTPEAIKPNKPTPKPEKPAEVNVAVKDIGEKIMSQVQFAKMLSVSGERVKESYPFDEGMVSEYVVYQAMINVRSDELAIFKLKDKSNMANIEKAINTRLGQLDKIWGSYLPDQHEKVKNHIIVKKGNYIMFAISDNQQKVEEVFNSILK